MVGTILAAIGRAVRRDVGTFRSLFANNFFFWIALILYSAQQGGVEPHSAYPFVLLLLLVLVFPLSSDPLDKVPPSRLALWPLTAQQRFRIRVISVLVSPVLWLAALLMIFWRVRPAIAMAFLTAVIGVQVIGMIGRGILAHAPQWSALRCVPSFPGRLGGLIRNHVRQMLQVLDVYMALILTLSAFGYRVLAARPDPEALPVLSLMVALTMSTYAQCLFGLDRSSSAMTRYRLFPIRGWEVLLSKDIAFLGVLFLLALPLDPRPGLAFGFFALAAGHHASVIERIPLRRWRFAAGNGLIGAVQCIGGFVFGMGTHRVGSLYFLASFAIYLVSLAWYGVRWDET